MLTRCHTCQLYVLRFEKSTLEVTVFTKSSRHPEYDKRSIFVSWKQDNFNQWCDLSLLSTMFLIPTDCTVNTLLSRQMGGGHCDRPSVCLAAEILLVALNILYITFNKQRAESSTAEGVLFLVCSKLSKLVNQNTNTLKR